MGILDDLIAFAGVTPPDTAREIMRLSLIDWAACGIAGARDRAWAGFVDAAHADGPCTQFSGGPGAAAAAALINGTLSHALDYDDTHFDHIGHTSVGVTPAALAVAQLQGRSLAAMRDAALIGAEAAVGVGLWLGRDHYQVGFHQTATAGAFGATVAAGRLLGLAETEFRHALGLCATLASGLKSQFGTMGKPLNAGLAARTGVEAARWAAAGMTSSADALEGPQGFGPTHHGEGNRVQFGQTWRMEAVSHKFHACCHGLHAALEALARQDLGKAQEIEIQTHPRWMRVCAKPAPQTGLEAKFSYAHVAAMAAHGLDTADIDQFTDAVTCRPDLVAYRARVRVTEDASLSEMQARVIVDGVEVFHDLAAPIPIAEREDRIMRKARALVGSRADALARSTQADDLEGFARLLAG